MSEVSGEIKKGDLIFVYGTLRKGQRADLSKQQGNFGASFVCEDDINGRMYHLGTYPGVKADSQDAFDKHLTSVHGEIFRIMHESIIALMDAYEGYNPDNPTTGLYNRIKTTTKRGRTVWVYTYNFPVRDEQFIENGDWCKADIPIPQRRLA